MPEAEGDVRELLRTRLRAAIGARDRVAVTALRSAISALDNAEAIEVVESDVSDGPSISTGEHVAGGVVGLGAAEAARRVLTIAEQHKVLATEISDRRSAADTYEQRGAADSAVRLREEAAVLERALGPAG